ncbi:MAG: hypothetical protein COV46_01215 [Deltaproteobacteria bacterium CG11_big_fil_rev_8_21_14_0_20_49_13]|nr:MAG: hypothetical protein COV46_01215 [Deltaproteobacteria bacterium CG11_big_fil_rev_8_21_14_0_20_49_13]
MKKLSIISLCIALYCASGLASANAGTNMKNVKSWLCYYGTGFKKGVIPRYDLYILSSGEHPALPPLKETGETVVGYLSVGEINKNDRSFANVHKSMLFEENPEWKNAFRVNISDAKWHRIIIDDMIPNILAEGFDGIFIDTIDVASYLQREKGVKDSVDQAKNLVIKIRKKYPNMTIVLNNGLFLLDDVGDSIDALVVEDVFTMYDFKTKKYRLTKKKWSDEKIKLLQDFMERFHKPVLALDYYPLSNKRAVQKISNDLKKAGLVPFISEIGLRSTAFHP